MVNASGKTIFNIVFSVGFLLFVAWGGATLLNSTRAYLQNREKVAQRAEADHRCQLVHAVNVKAPCD
jgi:hypothetical protein